MSGKEETPSGQISGYIEPPSSAPDAQQLDVSSGTANIKFDQLGPLVVNSNGTLSRIDNWATMTEAERERTLRVLGKRNQLRVAHLREGEEEAQPEKQQ